MPSLPPVSAKVIADAEQFVQEFRRAERSAAGSSAGIDREVGQLVTKISNKFKLADFGKDVLKGAGLFGGFDIARTLSEQIVDHWKEAARHASAMSDEIEKQVTATEKLISLRRTDDQNLEAMQKKARELARDASALVGPHEIGRAGRSNRMLYRDATNAEIEEAAKKTTEMKNLAVEIEQAQQAQKKRQIDQLLSDAKARGGIDYNALKNITPEDEARAADELRKWNDELDRQSDTLIALGDPMKQYEDRLSQITDLQKMFVTTEGKHGLSDEQAWAAKVKTWSDIADEANKGNAGKSTLKDLKEVVDVSAPLEKVTDGARELGLTFSSAFEDAVIGGSKFSDVLRGLEQDLERLWLRKNVTEKLFDSTSGVFSSVGMLSGIGKSFGFAANGADVNGGDYGIVGERGPELFVPKGSGTIIPNHALAGGSGGGGHTFNFTNNFQTGVTRQEVASLLPRMVSAAKAAVADGVQRGGGYRRALA